MLLQYALCIMSRSFYKKTIKYGRTVAKLPGFFYTSHDQVLQHRKKVLLRWRKKTADHRNIRHLLRNSPPDCFCQMLRIWQPRVASSNLANKQKRKQDIPAAPPAEMCNRHRDIRHSLRSSPPDCFCQMLRIWSLVSQVQILQINKKGSRTF